MSHGNGTIPSESVSPGVGIHPEERCPGCFPVHPRYSGIMSAQLPQFDSHRFVKRLTSAGLSEEVAEILAEEHVSPIVPADVATKADIAASEERNRAARREDIAEAEVRNRAAARKDLAEAEERIRAAARKDLAEAEERIRTAARKDLVEAEERIRVARREDIAAAEKRMQAEIALAVASLKDFIIDRQTSTLKWMFGMMLAFTGLILTAMANFR